MCSSDLQVKVIAVDEQNRVKLSRRAVLADSGETDAAESDGAESDGA